MADQSRESAQWRKGKTPIITDYLRNHQTLFSAIAGRGFTKLPGYAQDAESNLELTAKLSLSELNHKILAETIEREMKQYGIDMDLTYRSAAIQWEIEKHDLLNAWEQEYADIKKGMKDQEEALRQLEVEVGERSTYIIERKTEIELEAEGYRTQLATLDSSTASYEILLAQQKLLTAQKKLEIIPILESIIAKEQELLLAEQAKAAAYTGLIAAEQAVADKKESTLLPAMTALANKSEEYADELSTQIDLESQIADEDVNQANAQLANIDAKIALAEHELETAETNLLIEDQKLLLQIAQDDMENDILAKEINHVRVLTSTESTSNATILSAEDAAQDYVLDKKRSTENLINDTKEDSSQSITDAEKGKISDITNSEVNKIQRIAEINAESTLTARLTHLIG
jgi:hypothetical protein